MKRANKTGSATQWLKVCFVMSLLMMLISAPVIAQEDEMPMERDRSPVKNTFESIWLIDHQTVMVPITGTFEMDFQHRFGTWDKGYSDFYGIFASSNIRIGFDYVPMKNLQVGFGFTKFNVLWDGYAKYAIFRQGKEAGSPVSLTYYVNAAIDTRKKENTSFEEGTDRWSFFHELMVARKFGNNLSLQLSGNLAWFNDKPSVYTDEGVELGRDKNAQFSVSALARYKFSPVMGVIAAYDLPVGSQPFNDPEPNFSIGIEMVTSSHAFQVFVGNYNSLVPQYDHSFNANSFGDGEILIGFNITRLWNF